MHFLCVGLCRRKNCSVRAAVFTSGVTDWATASRTGTGRPQKEPPSSPSRPRWPCTTKTRFTSALWTGPSASTPYPERFSRSASSFSTSSTGSPTKCCGTRTSTQTCETRVGRSRISALNFVLRCVFKVSAWLQASRLSTMVVWLVNRNGVQWLCLGETHWLEFYHHTSLNECFWKCLFNKYRLASRCRAIDLSGREAILLIMYIQIHKMYIKTTCSVNCTKHKCVFLSKVK